MLFLLETLHGPVVQLERHIVLIITTDVLSKVAQVMGNVINAGIIDSMEDSRGLNASEGGEAYYNQQNLLKQAYFMLL